jgi:hypothetical protein
LTSFSPRKPFSLWPDSNIPKVAAGVYAIWHKSNLVYCGMSGREFEKAIAASRQKYGMFTRLASHASGRLSGDQFCVYIANRLVIPSITAEQLPDFASGSIRLDSLTKAYIHQNLEYQYIILESSAEAYDLERRCRNGEYFGTKPLLNPC